MISFLISLILGPISVSVIPLVVSSCLFRYLNHAEKLRESHYPWVLLFPFLFLVLHFMKSAGAPSVPRHLKEALWDNQREREPPYPKTPSFFIFGTTVFKTFFGHLFGGSLGRESVAVLLSTLTAPFLTSLPFLRVQSFRTWKTSLMALGFGVAVGNPWCALTFLLEKDRKNLRSPAVLWNVGFGIFLIPYLRPFLGGPEGAVPPLSPEHPLLSPILGDEPFRVWGSLLLFTLAACTLVRFLMRIQKSEVFQHGLLVTFPIAVSYALFIYFFPANRWVGLGIPVISDAFLSPSSLWDPLIKCLLTGISIGLGFFGGEYIPLLFMGATLGSSFSLLLGLPGTLLPSIGVYLLYGIAARIPLTALLLIGTQFGWEILPYALFCVLGSLIFRPKIGIFSDPGTDS